MVAQELLQELQSIRWDFDWTYDGRNRRIRANSKPIPMGNSLIPLALCAT